MWTNQNVAQLCKFIPAVCMQNTTAFNDFKIKCLRNRYANFEDKFNPWTG